MPDIIKLAIGLVLLVIANIALGSMGAMFDGTFDWIKLRNGTIKGAIVAACFVAFYVAGRMNPNILAIEVGGVVTDLETAANVSMAAAYVLYAKDVFMKLSKMVLNKTNTLTMEEEKPPDEDQEVKQEVD